MKKSDLMRMELIGMETQVVGEGCESGISGLIVDETKNTLVIDSGDRERTVPKKGNEFRFTYEGQRTVIRGSEILHRPEDRIKKVR